MNQFIFRLTLTLVIFGTILNGGAQEIGMRVPELSATVGETIDVPVYVDSSLTGHQVFSYQLLFDFTSYRLIPVDVISTGTMSEDWGVPAYFVNGGSISIANAGSAPLSGTGILFYIRFDLLNSGTGAINFSGGQQSNYFNEGSPPMVFDNGYVAISAPAAITVSPNSGIIIEGEQIQFSVSGGTAPYTWTLTDPALASIDADGLLTATDQGLTQVVAEDANGIIDTTNGFVDIRVASIYTQNTSSYQSGTVDLPVYITDVSDEGIVSGSLILSYSENYLEATGFEVAGTLLETANATAFNTFEGGCNFAFALDEPLSGDGILFYVTLQVTSIYTYGSNITTQNILLNETFPGKGNTSFFDVIPIPELTITPNTGQLVFGETLQFSVSGETPPVLWSSSDPSVASINASGLLTAHKSGVIQISAVDDIGAMGTTGNFQIYDTYVTIVDGTAQYTTIYDLPVTMGDLPPGQEVFAIQGEITFDIPELEFLGIETNGTFTDGWSVTELPTGNLVTFAMAGTSGFSDPGTIFYFKFQLTADLSPGEFAFVNFNSLTLNEGIPYPRLINGGITASDAVPGSLTHLVPTGWSGISSYIIPSNPAVTNIFAPISGTLEILYNLEGEIYSPPYGVNTIVTWDEMSGYVIKNLDTESVSFDGFYNANRTINVIPGWNLPPVISECPVDPTLVKAAIPGLQMIKEVAGTGIYWPAFAINTLGDLQPGFAYFMNSTSYGSFTYPDCPKGTPIPGIVKSTTGNPWNTIMPSPVSHTILLKSEVQLEAGFESGSWIGVFDADEICRGAVFLDGLVENHAITVYGDDPVSLEKDGMEINTGFNFRVYEPTNRETRKLDTWYDVSFPNKGMFASHGISAVSGFKLQETGHNNPDRESFEIYPNPSSGTFSIEFVNAAPKYVEICDPTGQVMNRIETNAASTTITCSNLSSGIYWLRAYFDSGIKARKLVIR